MTPRSHHPEGPSRLGRLYLCPGSRAASEGLESASTPESESGTRVHAAAAGGPWDKLTPDELEALERWEAFVTSIVLGQNHQRHCEVLLETSDGRWGYADLVIETDNIIYVIDLKTAHHGAEESALMLQLADYACAALVYYRRRGQIFRPVQAIAYLVWPGIAYRLDVIDVPTAARWMERIAKVLALAHQPEAPRVPWLEACQYCPAAGNPERCPESVAMLDLPVPTASGDTVALMPTDLVALAKPEKVLGLIGQAKLAQAVAGRVLERAKQLLAEGHESPEWEVVERQGRRRVVNTDLAMQVLDDVLTPGAFLACCEVGLGKLEEAFRNAGKQKLGEMTQKKLKTYLYQRLGDCVQRGGSYLVLQRRRRQIGDADAAEDQDRGDSDSSAGSQD